MSRLKTTTRSGFRGGKRIDPRPRKQRGDKPKDAVYGPSLPTTLQLNVEGLHASKICVISQLATRYKASVILLQETHCVNMDQLVIPNFMLAGTVLSRKHGLATFVHEKLKWTLVDHSCSGSTIEWLCVDIDGVKIINVYKPPPSQLTPSAIPVFPHPSLYSGDFNCQHTGWGYKSTSPDGECLADWATRCDFMLLHNPKDAPSSTLVAGTLEPTQTWHLRALDQTAGTWTDVSWKSSQSPNTDPRSSRPQEQWSQNQASRIRDGTFARPTGNCMTSSQTNLFRNFHLLTPVMSMRHTRTFVMPSTQQPLNQSHAAAETTTDHVGMQSARTSTRLFFRLPRVRFQEMLLLPYTIAWTKSGKNAGQRLLTPSTSRTPVGWHGTQSTI